MEYLLRPLSSGGDSEVWTQLEMKTSPQPKKEYKVSDLPMFQFPRKKKGHPLWNEKDPLFSWDWKLK